MKIIAQKHQPDASAVRHRRRKPAHAADPVRASHRRPPSYELAVRQEQRRQIAAAFYRALHGMDTPPRTDPASPGGGKMGVGSPAGGYGTRSIKSPRSFRARNTETKPGHNSR